MVRDSGTSLAEPAPPRPPRARLVIVVVLDQLASWVLARDLPHLPEDGAIRTLAARGAHHPEVVYPYASTLTACGHAAIVTGVTPAEHGVYANRRWDATRGETVAIVDDGIHGVIGHPGRYASPSVLRVDTVGDALDAATGGRARVVALSIKDRSAVTLGGRRPDLMLFFDKRLGRFTSTTHYLEALPAWLAAWERQRPLETDLAPWHPADAGWLAARAPTPDDAPGEGDWDGLGRVFPHHPRTTSDPNDAFTATPGSSERLLALAAETIDRLELGRDDDPDLLMISVSGTDYVGHVFGPDSWEWLDNLVRVDRALAALLRRFAERDDVAVMITSDHGVAPLAERSRAQGRPAFRLLARTLVEAADHAIDRALGPGDWALGYEHPYVWLAADARTPENRDRAVAAAIEGLRRVDGVAHAFDTRQARGWREDSDPIRRAVALSVPDDVPADVFIVPAEGSSTDEEMPVGTGTSHGSPYPLDTHVPVIFSGPGVTHVETRDELDQRRVAPTIAALLGIAPPRTATHEPLPGAPATARPPAAH